MSEEDQALLGVESCGCVTFASVRPGRLNKETQQAITRIIQDGGVVERMTVGKARRRKNFLPSECPHDPKGWEKDA